MTGGACLSDEAVALVEQHLKALMLCEFALCKLTGDALINDNNRTGFACDEPDVQVSCLQASVYLKGNFRRVKACSMHAPAHCLAQTTEHAFSCILHQKQARAQALSHFLAGSSLTLDFLQASVYLARSGKGNSRRVKARSVHAPARRLARTTITLGPDEGIAFGLRAVRCSIPLTAKATSKQCTAA